ncbi:flavo protein-like protein [Coniella lustricola]|uniref:Flavo protein-like protein n=1 Tax=Coniella lustricola TaxID=2025994 RepID=A0A2T3AA20_9PEZI|nr:flavo protein-like protein [Coniella lustricola]
MTTTESLFRVAVICGSTRSVRVGPQVTTFIHSTISNHLASPAKAGGEGTTHAKPAISLEIVDIAAFNLPLFDEVIIPQAVKDPSGYAHEHTRVWSAKIASYQAFVFVTPQYNWGIPASLKNAIDYLYNEWTAKPAMIVSYGGHGGGHAAGALKTVCQGLRMKVVENPVCLTFPDRQFRDSCLIGGDLALGEAGSAIWDKEKEDVVAGWDEMVRLLG